MVENDIFDLSVAKEENKFIEKSLLLESDVFSDVLEEMKDFPWVGSLIKLGKVGKGFMDLKFVWKIGYLDSLMMRPMLSSRLLKARAGISVLYRTI